MTASFGLAVVLYAVLVGLYCLGTAVLGRRRNPAVLAALIFLEFAVVVAAVLDGVALAGAEHAEVATNLGYLMTSLAVLPICAAAVKLDEGRWGSAALAVGCALLVVVSLRLHQTLGPVNA